jgi:hypothetical protein
MAVIWSTTANPSWYFLRMATWYFIKHVRQRKCRICPYPNPVKLKRIQQWYTSLIVVYMRKYIQAEVGPSP